MPTSVYSFDVYCRCCTANDTICGKTSTSFPWYLYDRCPLLFYFAAATIRLPMNIHRKEQATSATGLEGRAETDSQEVHVQAHRHTRTHIQTHTCKGLLGYSGLGPVMKTYTNANINTNIPSELLTLSRIMRKQKPKQRRINHRKSMYGYVFSWTHSVLIQTAAHVHVHIQDHTSIHVCSTC